MILLIDNYDSFTYNLYQYFLVMGERCEVRRNDEVTVDEALALAPRLIVFSPGPGSPETRSVCHEILEHGPADLPLLGICLGHQIIAHHYGARVAPAGQPVHGKICAVEHISAGLFAGLPNPLNVTRYHSLVVLSAGLPDCLEITAQTVHGEIMGLRHRILPREGVQFHPEALLTERGYDLLRNALPTPC